MSRTVDIKLLPMQKDVYAKLKWSVKCRSRLPVYSACSKEYAKNNDYLRFDAQLSTLQRNELKCLN